MASSPLQQITTTSSIKRRRTLPRSPTSPRAAACPAGSPTCGKPTCCRPSASSDGAARWDRAWSQAGRADDSRTFPRRRRKRCTTTATPCSASAGVASMRWAISSHPVLSPAARSSDASTASAASGLARTPPQRRRRHTTRRAPVRSTNKRKWIPCHPHVRRERLDGRQGRVCS